MLHRSRSTREPVGSKHHRLFRISAIPEGDISEPITGGDALGVARNGDLHSRFRQLWHFAKRIARGLPKLDFRVFAGRSDGSIVARGNRQHASTVRVPGLDQFSLIHVPQFDRTIERRAHQRHRVGTPCQRTDLVLVSNQIDKKLSDSTSQTKSPLLRSPLATSKPSGLIRTNKSSRYVFLRSCRSLPVAVSKCGASSGPA